MEQYVTYNGKEGKGVITTLTKGKQYKIIEDLETSICIRNDRGQKKYYYRQYFTDTPSPAKPSVNGELLGFLEIEIEKANKNGKDCNLKDGDLNRAQAWYSAAESFSIVKNKITELLNTPHGHESNIINCPSCNAVWDLSRHNSCQCGATLVTKASPAKAEQEGPTQASLMLDELCELIFNDRLYGTSAGVSGRPHDSDPEISKVKRKILDLISTTPPVKEVAYDELWDEFSEYIDDDIDSLSIFAGRTVLTEAQYNKLVAKLKAAPVNEAGQPRNLPIEELIKLSDEELNVEINKLRSRLGMGKSEEAGRSTEQQYPANWGHGDYEGYVMMLQNRIKELESRQQPAGESGWISIEDKPLYIDTALGWECTEDGEKDFIAAVPYWDTKGERKLCWWIRHCCFEDGTGLYVVGDDENIPAGWHHSAITHWKPWPAHPEQSQNNKP